jgi:uncharacterized protein (TIGR02246 family)
MVEERDLGNSQAIDRRGPAGGKSRNIRGNHFITNRQYLLLMNEEIANVIRAYDKSLNTGDAQAALDLFGSDPVYMPQNSPALNGREAVRTRFEGVFKARKFEAAFTIQEVVEMGDLAYARTTSKGQLEELATHEKSKVAHNELFILRKEQGQWKIHRYLFASANPAGIH